MKRPEILAPAGSMEALKAAVHAGADAIYMGGSKFGARAYADNPDEDGLLEAISYAHFYGKQLYLTVNTLIKENEMEEVISYLKPYVEAGLDAVIVQDLGLMKRIMSVYPNLPIHASTQMNITGALGAQFLQKEGASRIVAARELSLEELKEIKKRTDVELEVFVHGALCFCYSGRCLLSSMLGGRSGNRGRCAQPCRLPYEWDGNTQFYLSPKDQCALDELGALIECGVDSLKIEGRMKNPEYVAGVVSIYKKYVDDYMKNQSHSAKVSKEDRQALLETFNRGSFTKGYFNQYHGPEMMSPERTGHLGVFVGKIEKINKNQIVFRTCLALNKLDTLSIHTGHKEISITSSVECKKSETVSLNAKNIKELKPGMPIYRTKNANQVRRVREEIIEHQPKRAVYMKVICKTGQPFMLQASCGEAMVSREFGQVLEAMKQPVSEQKLQSAIEQTGNTPFVIEKTTIDMDENSFLPMGAIKTARREILDDLKEEIEKSYQKKHAMHFERQQVKLPSIKKQKKAMQMSVFVESEKQLSWALQHDYISAIYLEILHFSWKQIYEICEQAKSKNKEIYLSLPRIFREKAKKEWEEHKEFLLEGKQTGLLIHHIDEVAFLKEIHYEGEVVFNQSLYAYNQEAIDYYRSLFANVRLIAPYECNYGEMKELTYPHCDIVVYGHLPLMTTVQCLKDGSGRCNKKAERIRLKDRKGIEFSVASHCRYCYNTIENGVALSLLDCEKEISDLEADRIVLFFTNETEKECEEIGRAFERNFIEKTGDDMLKGHFTRGHFRRGIE